MTFFCIAAIISAISGLLVLEQTQAGQFMLSRPFFSATIFGLICGCPMEGTALGIAFELIYAADLPLGGNVPPNALAGAAAAVLAANAGMQEGLAFFYGMAFAWAYSRADVKLRHMRSGWNIYAAEQIMAGKPRINVWIARSLAADFLAMFIAVLAAGMGAMLLCNGIAFPSFINAGAKFVYSLIPVIGLSMLYFRFKNNLSLYNYSAVRESGKIFPEIGPCPPGFPVRKTFFRLFMLQAVWNFERLQNFGFLYSLMPFLKETYKTFSGLNEAMARNFAKINTNPMLGGLLAGAAMRMEKDYSSGKADLKRVGQLKTSLASAAAAAGDGLFWARLRPVSMQAGLAVCLICGYTYWLFGSAYEASPVSGLKAIAGPAFAVLAFAVPACIMRWRALKAGLCGNEENLLGLKLACPERLKFSLDLLGFIFSIALLIEVFVFFFIKTRQMDFSPRQTASRLILILAMLVLGRYAGKGLPLQTAVLALFIAALVFSALGLPLYLF